MVVGDLLFTSGQIALRPDGSLNDGDIVAQTQQVLGNLKAVIEAAGADLSKVVKTTVFLKNLDDFVAMNTIYGEAFAGHTPARSTVQVAKLPRDVLVEIEAIVSLR
jgi:2-iminobutanoate/2-iminopropanoate deaminase